MKFWAIVRFIAISLLCISGVSTGWYISEKEEQQKFEKMKIVIEKDIRAGRITPYTFIPDQQLKKIVCELFQKIEAEKSKQPAN